MTDKACVVCGKAAVAVVVEDGREWPVCDEHGLYQPGSLAADMEVARAAGIDFGRALWQAVRETVVYRFVLVWEWIKGRAGLRSPSLELLRWPSGDESRSAEMMGPDEFWAFAERIAHRAYGPLFGSEDHEDNE